MSAGNPDQPPPPASDIVAVPSTVDPSPGPELEVDVPSSSTLDPIPLNLDVPGPSTTFIPRQPSPPLPDLSHRPFPPNHSYLDDEEPDEVIAQLPIYLSPAIFPNLHLFQYPLHHTDFGVTEWASARGKTVSARMKEAVGRIEVEVPIKTETNVWRDERARELGYVTDVNAVNGSNGDIEGGKRGRKKDTLPKWGDKMRLKGEVVPEATGYYSGIIRDGALHLHPISTVSQFRTSMTYLDEFHSHENPKSQGGDDDDKRRKALPKPLVQKIRDEEKDGSGSLRELREKMVGTAQREEDDIWVPYSWKAGDDEDVLDRLERLIVPDEKRDRLKCATSGLDYLDRDV
ncbi:Sin-like protein conserved region-domain-containing protein [Naematelia encephala]|uniref:Sin-like protein conserved region-domain-containing protein n=1 Tax=Naematelia encephala TaxID=71784 RepID=A0A1Y2AVQ8_9TREE|nr:Sin-like protein conserved region-domain-containing protein [Naematelia encephala]